MVIAGGVSANKQLRADLEKLAKKIGGEVYYPRTEFCTDNGAMIAYAGMQRLKMVMCVNLACKLARVGRLIS